MSHQPMNVPALGVAPVADEKSMSDPSDSLGRSALMQQLTKPADDMLPVIILLFIYSFIQLNDSWIFFIFISSKIASKFYYSFFVEKKKLK